MSGTDDLIATLAETSSSVKAAPAPLALFAKWMSLSLAYAILLLLLYGTRDDLSLKLGINLFTAELGLLVAIAVTTGISAIALSFPDMYQKQWLTYIPLLPLILFIITLYYERMADNPPAPEPIHGFECLACITLFSLIPAVWMLILLRKQASTHYYCAGGIALLAASSVGCFVLRLSEKTDSISHLVEWHYLPMIGFGTIGLWLGRKLLKW